MRDLIDRDELRRGLGINDKYCENCYWKGAYGCSKGSAFEDACVAIDAAPSAEPEIIRCQDCKYAEVADREDTQDGYTCRFHRGSIWFSGSYCSWAERRIDNR